MHQISDKQNLYKRAERYVNNEFLRSVFKEFDSLRDENGYLSISGITEENRQKIYDLIREQDIREKLPRFHSNLQENEVDKLTKGTSFKEIFSSNDLS